MDAFEPIVLSFSTANVDEPPAGVALFESHGLKRRINTAWNRLFGYYPSFLLALKKHRARLLHAHFGPMGYRMIPLAQKTGIPLVTTFYGYDQSYLPSQQPAWRDRYHQLFDVGTAFLLEGSHMRQQLIELGCPPDKAFVQHLGVEVDVWPFKPRRRSAGDPLRVLFAARFTEKKGFRYAFEAFRRAIEQGADLELTVIGDTDGSERSQREKGRVLDQIEENDLASRITLRGFVSHDELVSAYYDHHILLAPSVVASDGDVEGGAPVTLIEAQATGLPVVSTFHCDIPEVVVDGETGLLAPERDVSELAQHLLTLDRHSERLSAMGTAGRRHIEANYNASRQGSKLEHRYRSFLP